MDSSPYCHSEFRLTAGWTPRGFHDTEGADIHDAEVSWILPRLRSDGVRMTGTIASFFVHPLRCGVVDSSPAIKRRGQNDRDTSILIVIPSPALQRDWLREESMTLKVRACTALGCRGFFPRLRSDGVRMTGTIASFFVHPLRYGVVDSSPV